MSAFALTYAPACFNFVSFLVQRLMFGVGEGPQGSVTARTMGNWFPKREYATAVGFSFAANPLGAAVGTPVVTALLVWSGHNWRMPFIVLGGVGLFGLTSVLALLGALALALVRPPQEAAA